MRRVYPENRFRLQLLLLLQFLLLLGYFPGQAQDREHWVDRPSCCRLSDTWLFFDEGQQQLVPYVPDYHAPPRVVYQWVRVKEGRPFRISFTAIKDLSLFLDNQLLFTADSTASYTLDLASRFRPEEVKDRYLLAVWQPASTPGISSFVNTDDAEREAARDTGVGQVEVKPLPENKQNPFVISLLLIGLIYGSLRTSFTSDFHSIFRVSNFFRSSALNEGFLARPISSWSSILFVIAFSLSFALVIVAIHTNIQNILILKSFFPISETSITARIFLYTFLVFAFIILKLLFLQLMAYIFDLTPLVMLQYREFIRSLLFMGIFLPVIMLLYLQKNAANPETVLWISNIAVSFILIFTTFRIANTVNNRVSLLNLHLFSYICATEIIPLAIMLKWIVFNF